MLDCNLASGRDFVLKKESIRVTNLLNTYYVYVRVTLTRITYNDSLGLFLPDGLKFVQKHFTTLLYLENDKYVEALEKVFLIDKKFFIFSQNIFDLIDHRVLGGLLTFKKIHRSWDMCFLMQNDIGINVY